MRWYIPFPVALVVLVALPLALFTVACGDESKSDTSDTDELDTQSQAALEVLGTWNDNFGGTTVITADTWGDSALIAFDNTRNSSITQSPATDEWNPNKFSKNVWTEPTGGSFWLCTVDYGLDTAAAAEASTKTADATLPDQGGCGGFSWSKMTSVP